MLTDCNRMAFIIATRCEANSANGERYRTEDNEFLLVVGRARKHACVSGYRAQDVRFKCCVKQLIIAGPVRLRLQIEHTSSTTMTKNTEVRMARSMAMKQYV